MASIASTPATARKSARASFKPAVFSQEVHEGSILNSTKRKRPSQVHTNEDDGGDDTEDQSSSEDDAQDSDEPDEEELRERRRKQKSKSTPNRPAVKKTRTNEASTTLAMRPAGASKTASKMAKQKARSRPSQMPLTGLYAEVFGKGKDPKEVAQAWHTDMEHDNVAGIREMINFLLRLVGCESTIENSDIDDIDNVTNKLQDLINEYATQGNSDYPLSGKSKNYQGHREAMVDFFKAVIHALHDSNVMYDEPAVFDNINIWTATMTSAAYRAFRHTATIVMLTMATAMTEIAKELQSTMSTLQNQLEAEKKKKTKNSGRIGKLEEDIAGQQKKLDLLDSQLDDIFNTTYVHRYRDVDEKIRAECAEAIGTWIANYRSKFLEGQYLRYLGWVLPDPNAHTRLEVIRQLKALYKVKQNIPALKAFTERFRARLVEMGSRDLDVNVRVETIDLLDKLRNAELLEPDDIDVIGQLVFDAEPRVRKAVAKFFVSSIEDLYNASVEDFDQEQFDETLPNEDESEKQDQPSKLWIRFKCLAQTLASQAPKESLNGMRRKHDMYDREQTDSRFAVAAQSIFNSMPELHEWQAMAGYVLHDHSAIATTNGASSLDNEIEAAYKLEEDEEIVLLDVLYCAVKLSMEDLAANKPDGKTKKARSKAQVKRDQEKISQTLSSLLPRFHSKFDDNSQAAKLILRLHELISADASNDVEEQDNAGQVEEITKQLTSHGDNAEVVAAASRALQAACNNENSKEAAEAKISELWQKSSRSVADILNGKNIGARGTLDLVKLKELASICGRFAVLAAMTDCSSAMETVLKWPRSKTNQGRKDTLFNILLLLISRASSTVQCSREISTEEDQLVKSCTTTLLFYFRWKVVALRSRLTKGKESRANDLLSDLVVKRSDFAEHVLGGITNRKPLHTLRINGLVALIEVHALFAALRTMMDSAKSGAVDADSDLEASLSSLAVKLNEQALTALLETHEALEKRFARKTNRRNIELPLAQEKKKAKQRNGSVLENGHAADEEDIDRPPEDSDDEAAAARNSDESSAEEEEEEDETQPQDGGEEQNAQKSALAKREARQKAGLLAETALCELTARVVQTVLTDIVSEPDRLKARLQVNRTKLGKSYGRVIAYLDEEKPAKTKVKKTPSTPAKNGVKTPVSKKKKMFSEGRVELSDDEIEDDDEEIEARQRKELDGDDPVEEVEDGVDEVEQNGVDKEDEIMGD